MLITVNKRDGSREAVLLLPLKDVRDFFVHIANEVKLTELFCAKPEGWGEALTDESVVEVLRAAEQMNDARIKDGWRRIEGEVLKHLKIE